MFFSFGKVRLTRARTYDSRYEVFLPLKVTGLRSFHLLAVWALNFRATSRLTMPDALQWYRSFLSRSDAVVAGDFNNSVFWDRSGKRTNFAGIADTLSQVGLASAYHVATGEHFGQERQATLWFLKRPHQRYHIDYCFVPTTWISPSLSVTVGHHVEWLRHSDHAPLLISVPDDNNRTLVTCRRAERPQEPAPHVFPGQR